LGETFFPAADFLVSVPKQKQDPRNKKVVDLADGTDVEQVVADAHGVDDVDREERNPAQ